MKEKENCWKSWVENRLVSIRNITGKDSCYHISGVNNPADTPPRVCKINISKYGLIAFSFCILILMQVKFDAGEGLKLVEVVVQNKAKG